MSTRSSPHLFVYGTLMSAHGHEMHDLLARHTTLVGTGSFRGKLYLVGDFPGAVPSTRAEDVVRGEVYRLDSPSAVLAQLDEYEDCRPASPDEGLYRREQVSIHLDDGKTLLAWIYLYNRPVDERTLIPSGTFAASRSAR